MVSMENHVAKAVITSAGKSSRMKHLASVMPKALFPLFIKEDGGRSITPIVDLIMGSLTAAGAKKFCFVVGKHKGLLMDYLFDRGVTFVFQNVPKGFGDAVLKASDFAGESPIFVHADDGVLTGGYKEAASLFAEKRPDCVLVLRQTDKPTRYGIAEVEEAGEFMGHKIFRIRGVEEKPQNPKSNYMLSAVYVFSPKIFEKLGEITVSEGELELTYGIQKLIKDGGKAYGILLNEGERWLNVGDVENYYKSLKYSYETSN
jgi:dTDP-glucose pyrophosphorylase